MPISVFNYVINLTEVVIFYTPSGDMNGGNLIGRDMFGHYAITGCINNDYLKLLTYCAKSDSTTYHEDGSCTVHFYGLGDASL